MLVRGSRVPYDGGYEEEVAMKPAPVDTDVPQEQQGNGFSTRQWVLFGALAFGASIGAGLLIPNKKGRKKETDGAKAIRKGADQDGERSKKKDQKE